MDIPKKNTPIPFARPFVPETVDLMPYLDRIRNSHMLTNQGPLHEELEQALADFLGVRFVSLFNNGSTALMVALKVLNLKGEVITTPFTWIATAHAIHWNNLQPVFADIEKHDLNIDPESVEKLITPQTAAILPVHVFGNPCRVNALQTLAEKHRLKLVYDAAHAFGVKLNGDPLGNFGDLSVLSFHATKVFNCFEGGAVICHDEKLKRKVDALRNHGFTRRGELAGFGLNGKMNELQAACGLIHLRHVNQQIAQRRTATIKYKQLLDDFDGIDVFPEKSAVQNNHAYFPVLVNPEVFGITRDEFMQELERSGIVTRAYFSPLVTEFGLYEKCTSVPLPRAQHISKKILCLPIFDGITDNQIKQVVNTIAEIKSKYTLCTKVVAK